MIKHYSKKALAKNSNAVTRKQLGGKTRKMRGGKVSISSLVAKLRGRPGSAPIISTPSKELSSPNSNFELFRSSALGSNTRALAAAARAAVPSAALAAPDTARTAIAGVGSSAFRRPSVEARAEARAEARTARTARTAARTAAKAARAP